MALTLGLAVKLKWIGLDKPYRALWLYLVWDSLGSLAMLPIPRNITAYAVMYMIVGVGRWVFYFLITLEVVTLLMKRYPGLAGVARQAVRIALIFAALVGIGSATLDVGPGSPYPILQYFQLADRTISATALGFMGLILAFLFWFPVRLNKNIAAYSVGFVFLFGSRIVTLLLSNLMGPSRRAILSAATMAIVVLVRVYWIVCMDAAAEAAPVTIGHAWNRAEEQRLLGQLDSINSSLVKAAEKTRTL